MSARTRKVGASAPTPTAPALTVIQGGSMKAAPIEQSPALLLAIAVFTALGPQQKADIFGQLEQMIRDRRDPCALAVVQLLNRHGGRR